MNLGVSKFVYNKNQLNWTTITQVMTRLIKAVRFHRHTWQPNVSSIYTSSKSEFNFDQNYKVLVDILKFPEHQESCNVEFDNSSYASFNMTNSLPLFCRISNYQTLSEEQQFLSQSWENLPRLIS